MSELDTIIADVLHSAKVDDLEIHQIAFLESIADRIDRLRPSAVEAPPKVEDGMLPDALVPFADEWYTLCERRFSVTSIRISGELAEAIVASVGAKASTPAAASAPVEWGYCCYGGPARQRACWSCAAWKPVASAPGLVMGNPISAAPVDGMAEIRWVIGGKVLGQPTGMDALEYANARIYPDSASDVRLPKLDKLRELFATPTSAPTHDRATPGERDALSALRKLAAKAAPGPYEYDSEHCTIVGNGHCPDCDDGCRHVHVDIEPSDLAFIIAAANYVSASLTQPIASSAPTPDRAAEWGEYMAKGAEAVLDALNALHVASGEDGAEHDPDEVPNAEQALSEAVTGLRSDIYEFRKRITQPIASSEAAHGEQDLPPLPDGYQVSEFIPGLWGWSMQVGLGKWENDGTMYGSQAAAVVAVWRNLADSLADELNSQPAAAPGAVDPAARKTLTELRNTHRAYAAQAHTPTQAEHHYAIVDALTAALATKPDGPRMGGEA